MRDCVLARRTLNPNEELYSQNREGPSHGPAAVTGVAEPPPPLHVRNSSTPTSGNLMRGGGTPGMGAEGSDDADEPGPPKRARRDG